MTSFGLLPTPHVCFMIVFKRLFVLCRSTNKIWTFHAVTRICNCIRIKSETGSLKKFVFVVVVGLLFVFSPWCIGWVRCLCAGQVLCISVLRVASGRRVKWVGCESALDPRGLFCWPFWDGGPGVSPTLCWFVIYSTRRFVLSLALWYFVIVFFPSFEHYLAWGRES